MPPDGAAACLAATAGIRLAITRECDVPESAIYCLSPEERAYAAGRLHARRRRQFVGGRFLLRRLLEQQTGQPPRSHDICASASGKPRCTSGVAISIAHTQGIIACAVARAGEVGVDIEQYDARRDWRRLARRCFPRTESAWLRTRPLEEYCQHWVLKEAWLKMRGTGIADGMSHLECRIAHPVIEAPFAAGDASHLSLFACHGAFIGLATEHVDHRNPILLDYRKHSGDLVPTHHAVRLASSELNREASHRAHGFFGQSEIPI